MSREHVQAGLKMDTPWSSAHLSWLLDTGETMDTADGKTVKIFEFKHQDDKDILSAWARHFRNHYCCDDEIDDMRKGYGCSRCEFLRDIKFPDSKDAPGPSVRAGDFGEILVADYVEFILNYIVPRTRYFGKVSRQESEKGIDVVGFEQREKKSSSKDKLITFEVKCRLVTSSDSVLQDAIDSSTKDFNVRKAESLNAMKQRLKRRPVENAELIVLVERFQNKADRPYREITGAAAVLSEQTYNNDVILKVDVSRHPNRKNVFLIVIRGNKMMDLVNELYRRAADEA